MTYLFPSAVSEKGPIRSRPNLSQVPFFELGQNSQKPFLFFQSADICHMWRFFLLCSHKYYGRKSFGIFIGSVVDAHMSTMTLCMAIAENFVFLCFCKNNYSVFTFKITGHYKLRIFENISIRIFCLFLSNDLDEFLPSNISQFSLCLCLKFVVHTSKLI